MKKDCDIREEYTIPETVEIICNGSFYAGNNLTKVIIGDNVKKIGYEAFCYSDNLRCVLIPESVLHIGGKAFDLCRNLTDVYYKGVQENWDKISIGEYNDYLLNAEIHFKATEDDLPSYAVDVPETERPSMTVPIITKADPSNAVSTTVEHPTTKVPSTTKKPDETTTTTKPAEDVHTHTAQLVVVPASCTVNGMKYTVCKDCGEPMGEITVVVAEGHKAGEWEVVVEPTTEFSGKRVKKCTVCGDIVDEEEIPKLSTVVDEKTGIAMDYSAEDYDGTVEITVKETFDGTAFDIVDTSLASSQKFICDIVMTVDGNETQPEGKVTVRIPLPEGYDYTRTFVYHVDTVTGGLEKMQADYVDGYLVFETTHFSYYAVVEELSVEIRNPSTKVIEYGNAIVLHADFEGDLPKGWKIGWTASNDNFSYDVSDDGKTCTVTPEKSGDTTFTATVYNSSGKEISKDAQIITSKAGIFQKIIAFFKKLFGLTKTIPQAFKGII